MLPIALPGKDSILFGSEQQFEREKNRIDGNSLKHKIVFIPGLEKLQGTFCLSNPFDSSLNTNGVSKLLGTSPSLIFYSETDFITIIACLPGSPGSWQPLSSKTLNILADNCCSSGVLSAGGGGWGFKGERLCIQRLCFAHPAMVVLYMPSSCVFFIHLSFEGSMWVLVVIVP